MLVCVDLGLFVVIWVTECPYIVRRVGAVFSLTAWSRITQLKDRFRNLAVVTNGRRIVGQLSNLENVPNESAQEDRTLVQHIMRTLIEDGAIEEADKI